MYKIIYLPTAEEVRLPKGMDGFNRAWFENFINNNHALYGNQDIFYPAEYTHHHYDLYDIVPKHLLEVIEV